MDPLLNVVRFDRPGIRKVLGDLEAEVMEIVWSRPADQGTAVRDVFLVLFARRGLAYTTVMGTMQRLAKKGLLRVEKVDQAYIYSPTYTQEQLITRLVGHMLDDLLVSFAGPMQAALQSHADADAATRAQTLLDAIAQRRAEEEPES